MLYRRIVTHVFTALESFGFDRDRFAVCFALYCWFRAVRHDDNLDFFFSGVFLSSPTDFVVDSRAVAKYGQGVITCTVTNPSGTRTETFIAPQSDGTYKISYTPFEEGTREFLHAVHEAGSGRGGRVPGTKAQSLDHQGDRTLGTKTPTLYANYHRRRDALPRPQKPKPQAPNIRFSLFKY